MDNKQKYWDTVANKLNKSLLNPFISSYKKHTYIQLVDEWIENPKNKSILKTDLFEEAFEDHYIFSYFSSRFKKSVGIDISKVIVKKAKKRLHINSNLFVRDVLDTQFDNNTFDVIFSSSTLDHMPKQDMILVMSELKRILKSNGRFILTLENKENLTYYGLFLLNKVLSFYPFELTECYSVKEIEDIVKNLDMTLVSVKPIITLPVLLNKFLSLVPNKKLQKKIVKLCKRRKSTRRNSIQIAYLIKN